VACADRALASRRTHEYVSCLNYTISASWAAERHHRAECMRLAHLSRRTRREEAKTDRQRTPVSAERSERVVSLAYELLDALADTQRLLRERPASDLSVCVHLYHLRDLQRVGREILATKTHDRPLTEKP
jgi:hypothetical protein